VVLLDLNQVFATDSDTHTNLVEDLHLYIGSRSLDQLPDASQQLAMAQKIGHRGVTSGWKQKPFMKTNKFQTGMELQPPPPVYTPGKTRQQTGMPHSLKVLENSTKR
jgi:hypothetical protein